jgi:hypothetical protein
MNEYIEFGKWGPYSTSDWLHYRHGPFRSLKIIKHSTKIRDSGHTARVGSLHAILDHGPLAALIFFGWPHEFYTMYFKMSIG